ncbi:MAG TPA: hypothetical protein EYQ82_03975 [Dehalococcoidia bacterium]|nr:hypothetical protein [Dehalococcoidia bacterium]
MQIACIQDHESVTRLGLVDQYTHVWFLRSPEGTGGGPPFVHPHAGFDLARLEVAIETPEST